MTKPLRVCVTGFYATGSSALIDLIKEYPDVHIAAPTEKDYEHTVLYSSGGLIDLGTILMNHCSPYNSDSAVFNFKALSRKLNNNNFGWFGSYRYYFGDDRFLRLTDELIDNISTIKERTTANHATKVGFSPIKAILQISAKIALGRNIPKLGRKYYYDSNTIYFAMPTETEFFKAAKRYTSEYMGLFESDNSKVEVFDHLLWPQHATLLDDYFEDNFKMIIVDRDPRDLYILNKYYWHKPPVSTAKPYFPTEPQAFIDEWSRTVTAHQKSDRVLTIHFEDLIYNYEKIVCDIERFLGLSGSEHNAFSIFVPDKSIENTQSFLVKDEWQDEVKEIEEQLAAYCYVFPFERIPDKSKWFDTQDNATRRAKKQATLNGGSI
ncbi:sulfotransferase domain-containing protein [Holdemania massiliensis]|uniref:sulfotransferase domain-containing protein n=1 Tax=Holdemania massiliensis TaxID=1468449 RepID=UPI0035220C24